MDFNILFKKKMKCQALFQYPPKRFTFNYVAIRILSAALHVQMSKAYLYLWTALNGLYS